MFSALLKTKQFKTDGKPWKKLRLRYAQVHDRISGVAFAPSGPTPRDMFCKGVFPWVRMVEEVGNRLT
jgi:hypothetical protein